MSASPPDSASPAAPRVQVEVNGAPHATQARSRVSNLLAELGLGGKRVAVAVNRVVVARSRYDEVELVEGDRIEILEAVGGG